MAKSEKGTCSALCDKSSCLESQTVVVVVVVVVLTYNSSFAIQPFWQFFRDL